MNGILKIHDTCEDVPVFHIRCFTHYIIILLNIYIFTLFYILCLTVSTTPTHCRCMKASSAIGYDHTSLILTYTLRPPHRKSKKRGKSYNLSFFEIFLLEWSHFVNVYMYTQNTKKLLKSKKICIKNIESKMEPCAKKVMGKLRINILPPNGR